MKMRHSTFLSVSSSLFLLLALFSSIKITAALSCFSCYGPSCEKFWKAGVEERKKSYSINCGNDAKGCYRAIKYKVPPQEKGSGGGGGNRTVELEQMKCYEPRPTHEIRMNDCMVSETEGYRTYCACNTGDFCIPRIKDLDNRNNGPEEGSGSGCRCGGGSNRIMNFVSISSIVVVVGVNFIWDIVL